QPGDAKRAARLGFAVVQASLGDLEHVLPGIARLVVLAPAVHPGGADVLHGPADGALQGPGEPDLWRLLVAGPDGDRAADQAARTDGKRRGSHRGDVTASPAMQLGWSLAVPGIRSPSPAFDGAASPRRGGFGRLREGHPQIDRGRPALPDP